MLRFFISLILLNLSLFLIPDAQAQADQTQNVTTTTTTSPNGTVVRREIVTITPAPKETLPPPTGYVSCFKVKATWYQDVWVAEHNVCSYSNSPSGVVWVEGYWTCNKYDELQGQCNNWDWKPAHWEKTVTVY